MGRQGLEEGVRLDGADQGGRRAAEKAADYVTKNTGWPKRTEKRGGFEVRRDRRCMA
ncbi:MAG: hypothetical protein R3E48_23270 [Burkholderiaceae bacterium]